MNGIVNSVMAVGALLLSRLKNTAEVAYSTLEGVAVESSQAMRGIIAGVEQIGILEVSQRLVTGIAPLLEEVQSFHATVRMMAVDLSFIRGNKAGSVDLMAGF